MQFVFEMQFLKVTSSTDCLPVCRSNSLSTEDSYESRETDVYKAIGTRHVLPDTGCGNVSRVCISQDSQTAFISDDMNRRLLLLNMNDSTTKFFDFDGKFREPWALVYDNKKKHLYTGDDKNCNIFVFDENMMKIDSISIVPDEISITALEVDSERNLLYVSDDFGDCIFVWNTSTKTILEKQSVDFPSSMKIKNHLIFVVSGTEKTKFRKNNKKCKLLSYELGSNCIFVYDRFEWTLKRTIRHDWLNPRGLHIDDNMNILTVALKISKQDMVSFSEYLYVLDENGSLKQMLKLNFDNVYDFSVYNKRILFVRNDALPRICWLDFS